MEGIGLVERALGRRNVGPYQLQAAIAAVHAEAATAAETDWKQIAGLYGILNVQPGLAHRLTQPCGRHRYERKPRPGPGIDR